MKQRLLGLLLTGAILTAACPMVLAVDDGYSSWTADELSREAYISALADDKGISYEAAEALDEAQNQAITRAPDEVIRYVTLEKKAGTISGGKGYTQDVYISVYAKYLYNNGFREPVELIELSAPYAYLPGISSDRITFDHGDYAITKDSATKSTVVVIGSFTYTQPGISVGVGGDILSVSWTLSGYRVVTEALTLRAVFTLADCA